MKKIIFGIVALLIATFGLYAFTNANNDVQSSETTLHWFDAETGDYLGLDTKTNIQNDHCGPVGDDPCANGFNSIDSSGNPVGTRVDQATRQ